MKYFLIIVILFLFQNETLLTSEQMYNVQRRMLIYRIVEDNYKSDNALPDKGEFLDLEVEKIDLEGAPKTWKLIKIFNNEYKFRSKKYAIQSYPSNVNFYILSRMNLVALDSNNELVYISGCFYPYRISSKFKLLINNPSSFHNYIKIKLFKYGLWDIKFIKKNRKFIKFKAFSGILDSNVVIKIDINDFDNIEVKELFK